MAPAGAAMSGLELQVSRRAATDVRCSYCHDSLEGEAVGCPGCATRVHVECADELTRCPSVGCDHVLRVAGSAERACTRCRVGLGERVSGCSRCGARLHLGCAVEARHRCPRCPGWLEREREVPLRAAARRAAASRLDVLGHYRDCLPHSIVFGFLGATVAGFLDGTPSAAGLGLAWVGLGTALGLGTLTLTLDLLTRGLQAFDARLRGR